MESTTNAAYCASQAIPWEDLEDKFKPGLISLVRAIAAALNLPPAGRQYLRHAVKAPSRRVRSTAKSMSGAYPSTKMGATVGFESHTLELPAVTTFEHDSAVEAFFNQPPSLAVKYKRNGRVRCYRQTPDFLVVRRDAVTLVECKPLSQIALRNSRDPDFYVQDGIRWTCPALQAAAAELGMRHEVWTEGSFSSNWLRNVRMVGDYMLRTSHVEGYDDAYQALRQWLDAKGCASVSELLEELREQVCVDHLYLAVGRGDIAFDMEQAPLVEPERCFVYRDVRTMRAFQLTEVSRVTAAERIVGSDIDISAGMLLDWDGATWRCVNTGNSVVMLCRGERHEALPRPVFDQLIRGGIIRRASSQATEGIDPRIHERIVKASESELRSANLRHTRIMRYLAPNAPSPASRTERRYVAAYRQAQAGFGNGYIGLLPGFAKSGNRLARLIPAVIEIATRQVRDHYLNATNKHKKTVFTLVADECAAKSLPPPSYAWFCRFIDKLPAYSALASRAGTKGAYSIEPRMAANAGMDSMEPERPFERAHIDHTLIDVETIFGETSEPLGRCWLTVMIDHYSRRVLAHYLTYDAPSYRSVMMVMRQCVKRYGRLPEELVVDGGKEFASTYFETTCALYKVKIIRRPVTKPRFGSQIERFFGTCNTNLFHFMSGNTQLRKNVRQMTEEVNPSRSAIWTLPELNRFTSRYFYDIYDNLEHRELLVTPRFAFERGLERHGNRADRLVSYNELFVITTSPAPAKGKAKVQADGVKIHYLYYYSPELVRHLGKEVLVRYDPFDKSIAWAYVDGSWLQLRTRHDLLLRGFTQHDLDLATAEWRKRRSVVEKTRLSEPLLVKFLKEILETETLLLERKRAAEERRIREAEDDADSIEQAYSDESPTPSPEAVPQLTATQSPSYKTFATVQGNIEILETM
jgi:putative transposase